MRKRWFVPTALVAAFLLAIGFVIGPSAVTAQDMSATPSAMDAAPHPAHLHLGTCATLGEVVYPLTDVAPSDAMGTPEADDMMKASPSSDMGDMGDLSYVVAESTTTVDASLDDIISGDHALNVHESMENIQNYIACGDVTGTPTDGELLIELAELNGSGFTGLATLTDNGDGTTTVEVVLSHAKTWMATPTV